VAEKEGDYVSRADYDRLMSDLEATQAALEEQLTQNDAHTTRIKELEPFEGQAKDATGKLRSLAHQRAYEELAGELKIRPEFKDDVWKLAGFEPKGDEPDTKALREHLGKFLENKKHYTEEGKPASKLTKGEGSDRGGKNSGGDGKFRATEKQLNDADWMSRNQSKIAAASLEGNFEIVGDEAE
jgi:hypothetical protein